MPHDTITYNSVGNRPLPEWLTNQRDGLNTIQPVKTVMKEDHSLGISLGVTGSIIIVTVILLTLRILRKKSN